MQNKFTIIFSKNYFKRYMVLGLLLFGAQSFAETFFSKRLPNSFHTITPIAIKQSKPQAIKQFPLTIRKLHKPRKVATRHLYKQQSVQYDLDVEVARLKEEVTPHTQQNVQHVDATRRIEYPSNSLVISKTAQPKFTEKNQKISKNANKPKKKFQTDVSNTLDGFITIKGSKTAIKISGYIKLDIVKDLGQDTGQSSNLAAMDLRKIPLTDHVGSSPTFSFNGSAVVNKQRFEIFARQSRINFMTKTPVNSKEFKTFIEVDFYGTSSSESFSTPLSTAGTSGATSWGLRVRHAYGEYAGWLAGQTWSNFADLDTVGVTVEFNGVTGQCISRRGQLRYTASGKYNTFSVALENPVTEFVLLPNGTPHASGSNMSFSMFPDFTFKYIYKDNWGQFGLRGLLRQHKIRNYNQIRNLSYANMHPDSFRDNPRFDGANKLYIQKLGYGMGAGIKLKTIKESHFFAQANYGRGIGGYIFDAQGYGTLVEYRSYNILYPYDHQSPGSMKLLHIFGGVAGYQHHFNDKLKMNFLGGITKINLPKDAHHYLDTDDLINSVSRGALNRRLLQLGANIIYSPVKPIDLGLEYLYFRRDALTHPHAVSHLSLISAGTATRKTPGTSNPHGKLHARSHRVQAAFWYKF